MKQTILRSPVTGLGYLTTIPRIDADVCWGNPSCFKEALSFTSWQGNFAENGLKVSAKVLEDLYTDLPRLYEALFTALRRRKLSDLC